MFDRDCYADCRIVEVEPIVLAAPRGDAPVWRRGWGQTLLVRVRAACGIDGWGISETPPEVGRAIIAARPLASFDDHLTATIGGLGAAIAGRSAADRAALWQAMYDATLLYGRSGAALQAISAVDIACADLVARYLGVGVPLLLGGRFREDVPAYASAVLPDDAAAVRELAAHVEGAGFTAVKLAWGTFREEDRVALGLVEIMREALTPGIRLLFDVGYERRRLGREIVRLVRALERFDPLWIEEPCHPDDLDGYRLVASRSDVPIAAGEACDSLADFAALVATGVDILQPDLARCGGFTSAARVATLARCAHRRVVPHAWQNDLLLAATLCFAATLPDDTFAEVSVAEGPLRQICHPGLPLVDGRLTVPQGPGIGVAPDPELVSRYRVR